MQEPEFSIRFRRAVFEKDPAEYSRLGRAGVFLVRLVYGIGRKFADGQINLWAMSLVYTTLLSLVPLIAVSFSVLKAFGVQDQLEPALLKFLAPLGEQGGEVSRRIVEFVGNIQVGVLGAVGIAFLFYTVISLLSKIEEAFNAIWQVPGTRKLSRRFSDYLSALLVGPVLIFAAFALAASVRNYRVVLWLLDLEPLGSFILFISRALLPSLLIGLAFAFLYKFLTNTTVRASAALAGGLFAGVLWVTVGRLFTYFIASSSNYSAIYSGFAAAILFILWLNIGWLVTLVGAQIAFYWQNPHCLELRNRTVTIGNRRRETLALAIMALIGRSHYYNQPPWTLEALATFYQGTQSQSDTLATLVQALAEAGLIMASADTPPAYLPARAIETIPLRDVVAAARGGGEASLGAVDALAARIDAAIARTLEGLTVKDLVLEEDPEAEKRIALTNVGQS